MKEMKYLRWMVVASIFFTILISSIILGISALQFNSILDKFSSANRIRYIKREKEKTKHRIEDVVSFAKTIKSVYPKDIEKQKELTTKYINNIQNPQRYIFVLSDINLENRHRFAKMLINPNRPDLVGKYLDDNYKDAKGKAFRHDMVADIEKDGDSFVSYYYKEVGKNEYGKKISYFRYIKSFNWIVATGVYYDDIDKESNTISLKIKANTALHLKNLIMTSLTITAFLLMLLCLIMLKLRAIIKMKNDSLKQHKNIFQAMVHIQHKLISSDNLHKNIEYMLKKILHVIDVDRVYIFENRTIDGQLYCSQKFEYTKEDVSMQINNPLLQNLPYSTFPNWKEKLSTKRPIESLVKDLSKAERELLEPQDVKSILILPIFFEQQFWGFIGFDDCKTLRKWNRMEKETIHILADSFVSILRRDVYNQKLERKVQSQIKEIRKKDNMLVQQSKMAAMGEMIGNIAHQWRQPLNVIGVSLITLQIRYETGILDDEFISNFIDKVDKTINNMSKTIEDFRNFFIPNKNKEVFNIQNSINETLGLMVGTFDIHNIHITICQKDTYEICGYKNEFTQAILVILNNSKDAIVQNNIKKGSLAIHIFDTKEYIHVEIWDNGGGIEEKVIDRIFEPYFTTKFKSHGTGVGLYMAKEIIEKHMNGYLSIENYKDGTKNIIKIPKEDV